MVKLALIGTVGLKFPKIVDVSGVSPIDSTPSIAAGPSICYPAGIYVASIFPR